MTWMCNPTTTVAIFLLMLWCPHFFALPCSLLQMYTHPIVYVPRLFLAYLSSAVISLESPCSTYVTFFLKACLNYNVRGVLFYFFDVISLFVRLYVYHMHSSVISANVSTSSIAGCVAPFHPHELDIEV